MMPRFAGRGKSFRTRVRILLLIVSGLLVIVGCGGVWLNQVLRGSLPQLDGQAVLTGLAARVTVERDVLGVPTIRGTNRPDVARATGFLHAQDRFFQMDLLRRSAAGELAELFGEAALTVDQKMRIHRFRMRANRVFAMLPSSDQTLIDAYSTGVNDGLAALSARPFEYLVLRAEPAPWLPEDTLLAIYAMYLDLQDKDWPRESTLGVLHDVLPEALYEFLTPLGTSWDAPLAGGPLETPPVPGPQVVDLRGTAKLAIGSFHRNSQRNDVVVGSNNWAVAGGHTVHGSGILANDMHLPITVPNTWYRVSIVYPDADGHERRITGVTLPGTPAIAVGSNGRVAWGFTNAMGDWSDLVILEPTADSVGDYLAPDGPRRFERHQETIRVKGGEDRVMEIEETLWGPVIDIDHRGRRRALRWVAHDRETVNMALVGLEAADTLEMALEVANRVGIPAQNFVAVDSSGRIGWTIAGPIPRRFGHEGRLPSSWANGERGWDGWLSPDQYPRISDPPQGRLWTANARVVGGAALAKLGDGGYDLGARARQIRDGLFAIQRASERDMLALQLDDRALFLGRWRELLLAVLTSEAVAADPRRQELRDYVDNWGGRAAVGSVGYRMVRAFRTFLADQVFGPLTAKCRLADPRFDYSWIRQYEGPLWRLVEEQPLHLLNPRYKDWQAQFLSAVDAMLDHFLQDGSNLEERNWGQHNISQIRHPLSQFIPGAGPWLDMPDVPLPGDHDMPRVHSLAAGVSQRLVVSPGREADGIFHMPGGQSAHPLSPYYSNGHEAWVRGEPTPFLPGPVEHTLVLVPAES